jgi:hypothetical protein
MPGFKRFRSVAVAISGVELMHRIRKDNSTSQSCAPKILLKPCCTDGWPFGPMMQRRTGRFLLKPANLHQNPL